MSCSGLENAQISVVRCLMPTPILVETFMVDCKRIMCMKVCVCMWTIICVIIVFLLYLQAIPTTRAHPETSVLGSPPSGSLNVWLGSSCGKLEKKKITQFFI